MTKRLRILILFVIATQSLLLTGFVLSPTMGTNELLLLLWLGISGTLIIYGSDIGHHSLTLKKSLRKLMQHPLQILFVAQFILLVIPAAFILLSWFQLIVLASICLLGWLYSIPFKINQKQFQLKNMFTVKNTFIGFAWGALIVVGAGTITEEKVLALFLFTSLQIVVGSIVRDCADIQHDSKNEVRTLPVIIGLKKTIIWLHVANLLTFLPSYLIFQDARMLVVMGIVIGWKALILEKARRNNHSMLWTQTFNILTCFVIFILILILRPCVLSMN